MTTKDEALNMALHALKLGAAMYSPAGTAHAQIAAAIAACREALAQKDEQEPVLWKWALHSDPTHIGYYTEHPSKYGVDMSSEKYEWTPLYTVPPKRQPLTDEQRYALIEKHLGLERRQNATVIDHRTGRWTDAARYFTLMDAAIEAAHGTGEQT